MKDTSMKHEPEVFVVQCPNHIKPFRESNHDTICIDAEISAIIHYLWSMNIITLGCCSGHGTMRPSLVIHAGYTEEDIKEIRHHLDEASRPNKLDWEIMQWQHKIEEV